MLQKSVRQVSYLGRCVLRLRNGSNGLMHLFLNPISILDTKSSKASQCFLTDFFTSIFSLPQKHQMWTFKGVSFVLFLAFYQKFNMLIVFISNYLMVANTSYYLCSLWVLQVVPADWCYTIIDVFYLTLYVRMISITKGVHAITAPLQSFVALIEPQK